MLTSDEMLLDRLTIREAQLMQQADAIDVKASVMVVAVTFLAGQSTFLLSRQIGNALKWEQVVSILLQVLAGVLLGIILRVHTYKGETTEEYPAWRTQLVEYHSGDDARVAKDLWTGITEGIVERCKLAADINDSKAAKLGWAYGLIAAAFLLNILVLYFQPFKWIYV
jgi:hypothetical protein